MVLYYFDTCIWLDLFEDRNNPIFPKSDLAQKLLSKIILNNDIIFVSDLVFIQLNNTGYSSEEINTWIQTITKIIIFIEASEKELRKAKDLSVKRQVPKGDAIHALIARNHKAVLVTYDQDFEKLNDIINSKTPRELV